MKISSYFRMRLSNGEVEELPFSDIDGKRFGASFERGEGIWYSRAVALEIVNNWNRINSIQPSLVPRSACIYWIA